LQETHEILIILQALILG